MAAISSGRFFFYRFFFIYSMYKGKKWARYIQWCYEENFEYGNLLLLLYHFWSVHWAFLVRVFSSQSSIWTFSVVYDASSTHNMCTKQQTPTSSSDCTHECVLCICQKFSMKCMNFMKNRCVLSEYWNDICWQMRQNRRCACDEKSALLN